MMVRNGRMVTTDAADCCCNDNPCDVPPVLSVCAAYDLFNLPPSNASENYRHQILLPMAARTAITVNMRARIDWSSRGGEQLFDIVAYRLKDGTNNDASENIKLYPAIQKDAGGCWRVVEWRNVAYIELDRVVNMDGNYLSIPFQACVRLRMTANGWLLFIEPTDPVASDNGTFTCRRSNGNTDSVTAAADAQHQSTFKGFGQTREPFASQVTGGLGRMLQVALTDYSAPDPNVVPTGCPPYSGVLSARASAGTVCTPGQVTAPGRFRLIWNATYTRRQRNVDAGVVTEWTEDITEEQVLEYRSPFAPPETDRKTVVNTSVDRQTKTVNGIVQYDTTTTSGNLNLPPVAATALAQMVIENQSMDALVTGAINSTRRVFGGLTGCQGSQALSSTTSVTWSGADSLTLRTSRYDFTRSVTTAGGDTVNETISLTKSYRLESIDVQVCSDQPGAPVTIPPADVARAKLAAYFGRTP